MSIIKQLFLDIIESGGEPPIVYVGPHHTNSDSSQENVDNDEETA